MRVTVNLTTEIDDDPVCYRLFKNEWIESSELEDWEGDSFDPQEAVNKELPPPPESFIFWDVSFDVHGTLSMDEIKNMVKGG